MDQMDPFPGGCLDLPVSVLPTFFRIDLSVDDSSFSRATICHPDTPIQSEHERVNKAKIITDVCPQRRPIIVAFS